MEATLTSFIFLGVFLLIVGCVKFVEWREARNGK